MDGKEQGVTPADIPFKWYGTHALGLEKDGYNHLEKNITLKSPPYLWIPFDLVMELIPININDKHSFSFDMTPLEDNNDAESR